MKSDAIKICWHSSFGVGVRTPILGAIRDCMESTVASIASPLVSCFNLAVCCVMSVPRTVQYPPYAVDPLNDAVERDDAQMIRTFWIECTFW